MYPLAPMAGALVGILRPMQERIDRAVQDEETWSYQFGLCPEYTSKNTIRDAVETDNDIIHLSFLRATDPTYTHHLVVGFEVEPGGEMDGMSLDINLNNGVVSVYHPCGHDHPPFSDIMDMGSIIQALAIFTLGERVEAERVEQVKADEAAKAARQERLGRFRLIQGKGG